MCRCPETVETKPFAIAGKLQRAIANQARTKQGSGFHVVVCVGNSQAEAGVRNAMRAIAAVARESGEHRFVAQILPSASAVKADAAGPTQPGNTSPIASSRTSGPTATTWPTISCPGTIGIVP